MPTVRAADCRDAGFTLIELLVVLTVIGVLAAIAVPVFLDQRRKGQDATLKHDVRTMALAFNTWVANDPANYSFSLPSNAGWSAIARTTTESVFSGDRTGSIAGNVYPPGFDPPALTPGTAMGVLATPLYGGEFCIVANRVGSNHETYNPTPAGVSAFAAAMFYDSAKGGIFDKDDLPAGGACRNYRTRIDNGT